MVRAARFLAPAAAVLVDRAVGDRPLDPHPVALFGTVMNRLEERWWADDRGRGVVHALAGAAIGAGAGVIAPSTTVATYVAVGGRSLDDAAVSVESALLVGDVVEARRRLRSLVGRDPTDLDEEGIARAVVESVGENTVDAVVAPVVWAVLAGAPGVLAYRAVNTLDAMVGHRSPRHLRFGWASARLDDAMNVVPARLAAGLVLLVRPHRARAVITAVRRDAPAHPSPSGGVIEAAFAGALGRRLGGPVRYGDRREDRPILGDGPPVGPTDIGPARRLARDVDLALAALLATAGLLLVGRNRRPGRRSTRHHRPRRTAS